MSSLISSLLVLSAIYTLSCLASDCSHIHYQSVKGKNSKTFVDHITAGLTRECLPQVEEKSSDCPYIKCKKIELLSDICTTPCLPVILDELVEYTADGCTLVVVKAIQAIGATGVKLTLSSQLCVARLLELLSSSADYIVSETLVALSRITLCCNKAAETILPHLPTSVLSVGQSEGRAAMLWFLGEFGQNMDHAPYVLEEAVNCISDEASPIVQLQLLTSVMKLFFKRAPECQEMLGRVLEHCVESGCMDLRDRALLYYRLLQCDVHQAQRIVSSCQHSVPKSRSTRSRRSKVLVHEFNTLAVMYEAPSNTFISQECPYSRGHGPSSRDNALHWNRTHPVTTSGDSVTDHVMDELDSVSEGHTPHILLDPSAHMTAREFESKWLEMPTVREFKVHLSQVPSSRELTKSLQSRFVMTMASTPDDQPVIKMFFYAQHVSTRHLFLADVSIAVANGLLSFTLKCENHKQAAHFVKHFFETLGLSRKQLPMLQWKMCEDMPTCVKNVKGVFYKDALHLGGGFTGSARADAMVYSYSPTLELWKLLPASPLKWFAMAVFRDELVLIGGKETSPLSKDFTNKLAVWDGDNAAWSFSLPPMLARRSSPTAIAHGGRLIVAGGNQGLLDYSVEILNSDNLQWQLAAQLPVSCSSLSTVCNDCWYFYKESDRTVIHTSLSHFISSSSLNSARAGLESGYNSCSCSQESQTSDTDNTDGQGWQVYCQTPFTPVHISTVHGYLVASTSDHIKCNGHLAVFAYFPETKSWIHVGNLPGMCSSASFIPSPSGELFIAGGDGSTPSAQYSKKVFSASMKSIASSNT